MRLPTLAAVAAEGTTMVLEDMAAALEAMEAEAEATMILRRASRLPNRTMVGIMDIMDTMGIMAAKDSLNRKIRRASRALGDHRVSRRLGGGMGVTMISMVDGEQETR